MGEPLLTLIYVVTGSVAGLASGLLGVGGGAIMVPILILSFSFAGFDQAAVVHTAIGTSLAAIIFGMGSSAWSHWRRNCLSTSLLARLAPGMMVGVALGSALAYWLPAMFLRSFIAALLTLVALKMFSGWMPSDSRTLPGRGGLFGVGGAIGTLSAWAGIGGGGMTVPFLNWCGVPMRTAVGTSAACGVAIAICGAASFAVIGLGREMSAAATGFIHWPAMIALTLSSVAFAPLGAALAHRLDPNRLKGYFAAFLLLAAALELGSGFEWPRAGGIFYPRPDPVAWRLGPLAVHWYGLMYLLAFVIGWRMLIARGRRRPSTLSREQIDDLMFYLILGIVLGGRLGFALFYAPGRLIAEPLWLLRVWEGGMSFHGGALGALAAIAIVARRCGVGIGAIADLVVPIVPIGLGLGRCGNFINQELIGRVSELPWALVFEADPARLPRHPSQLYEALLEGVALYIIVNVYAAKPRPAWSVTAVFALAYGCMRFAVEFLREPDAPLWLALTRGQWLSLAMILAAVLIWRASNRRHGFEAR